MPSWILPGHRDNTVMRHKTILETSLAFSRTHNSRNTEYFWYPLWDQTLSDLVSDIPNLIVAPQFSLWYAPIDDDVEDVDEGEDEGEGEDDISLASTIPGKGARGAIVDFAILNLTAIAEPPQGHHYRGWRITAATVGLLVEVKRFPHRRLKGPDLKAQILLRVDKARDDLTRQDTSSCTMQA
ncbi:hypothetical protein BDR07DRAFT_1011984 [Suillus spraguei]|nr:hypothetical protein BDR07DRAFT_1011984 [Suillus spraguei]